MYNLLTSNGFGLEYAKWGHGKHVLLAFHGFGRNAEDFQPLAESLQASHTIYAFNLFFHGNSCYPNDRIEQHTISPQELTSLFSKFLESENISSFSVLGYSLGAKIALTLAEALPDRLIGLNLIAPDGIKVNFWYWALSHTLPGRAAYKSIIHRPGWFLGSVKLLAHLSLIDSKLQKFVVMHLESKEQRQLVYNVWMVFRNIQPNINNLAATINRHQLPTLLILGKHDRIIPPRIGAILANKLVQKDAVKVLETGHNLLSKKHLPTIVELLGNEVSSTTT